MGKIMLPVGVVILVLLLVIVIGGAYLKGKNVDLERENEALKDTANQKKSQ